MKNSNPPVLRINIRGVTKALLLIMTALLVIHIVLQYLYHVHGIEIMSTLRGRFDVDNEISVPTWFNQILLLIPAVIAGILFWTYRKWQWLLLGGVLLLLSIDEGAMLHEGFIDKFREWTVTDSASGLANHTWLIPVGLALVLLAALFLRFFLSLPRKTQVLLAAGLGIYVFGAIVYETIGLMYVQGGFAYEGLNVAFEEALEMTGAIIVTYALLDYLSRENSEITLKLENS